MRTVMLYDTNALFRGDLQGRLMIGGYDDLTIHGREDFADLEKDLDEKRPDEIVVASRLLSDLPASAARLPVTTYARNEEEMEAVRTAAYPTYGIVSNASGLLEHLEKKDQYDPNAGDGKDPVYSEGADDGTAEGTGHMDNADMFDQDDPGRDIFKRDRKADRNSGVRSRFPQRNPDESHSGRNTGTDTGMRFPSLMELDVEAALAEAESGDTDGKKTILWNPEDAKTDEEIRRELTETKRPSPDPGSSIRDRVIQKRKEEEQKIREEKRQLLGKAGDAFRKDAGYTKERAKVITVTSAKGGVGKTTIACELATYLACTSGGRENFKVCLVDGNIAFGGVLSTLDFSAELANMSHWSADIEKKLGRGMEPSGIRYSEKQIAFYLQQQRDSGLFALLAPITHEDSMFIESAHFSIMLDNLIDNGGFDFIVCDTANNADDYAVTALERADTALLVLTQNVNTANSNRAFLSTMAGIGFDTGKFRLVLNQVKAGRIVGLDAQEMIDHVTDPATGKKYECFAQIKDTDEVRTAGNLGEPMVFRSGSEFTRNIGEIATRFTGHAFSLEAPQKKGLIARVLGRK